MERPLQPELLGVSDPGGSRGREQRLKADYAEGEVEHESPKGFNELGDFSIHGHVTSALPQVVLNCFRLEFDLVANEIDEFFL